VTLIGGTPTTDTLSLTGVALTARLDATTGIFYGVAGGNVSVKAQNLTHFTLAAGASKTLEVDNGLAYTVTPDPAAINAGSVVADLYSIAYSGFGPASTILLKSKGASLTVVGSPSDDVFTVGTSGTVKLANYFSIVTSGISSLSLQDGSAFFGTSGNDVFNVPLDASSVYTSVNVIGSSYLGGANHLILTGPAGTIALTSTSATLGKCTVSFPFGIPLVSINPGGGNSTLAVQADPGVQESFTLSASTTAKAGHLLLTGPFTQNFDFTGVANVSLTADPADGDTLTVQGTTAADTAVAKLNAAGTAADPVLQLQTAKGATLLSLTNYVGVAQLNLQMLAGNDIVNVYTANAAAGRTLSVDGSSGSDTLNVFYSTPPTPIITQSPGLVELNFGTADDLIYYNSIEVLLVKKK
jgi:hypothetical protein